MALKKRIIFYILACLLFHLIESSSLTCRSDTIDAYAFCCCKPVIVASSTIAATPTLYASLTPAPSASTSINVSATASSTAVAPTSTASITPTPTPSPTPVFNNSCYIKINTGNRAYNDCYCGFTRPYDTAFNGTAYTNAKNATSYEYKCWNLPKPKLFIGGLFDSKSDIGRRILPAADLAIREINKNNGILPAYDLALLKQNTTNGTIRAGSGVLLDYLNQEPKKVALLGPDDDDLAKSVAAIAGLPRYKLLQISYGTSAVELALDHKFYPYFFRTKPYLDLLYNLARVEMLEKFQWKEIALLHSKDAYYSKLNDVLRTVIQSKGMAIAVEEEFVNDPTSALQHIQRNNVHVILGTFSAADTNKVLCEAYKLKMYGPRYVYLFVGTVSLGGARGCTTEHVRCAARYQFFFQKKDDPKCPGTIKTKFDAEYSKQINKTYHNTTVSPMPANHEYGAYTYDAIYAIARALHSTDTNKSENGRFYHDYQYGRANFGGKIKEKIVTYDHCGASGKVIFDTNGNRYYQLDVLQKTFDSDKGIGTFDNRANAGSKLNINPVWPGRDPYRKTEISNSWRFISKELYIIYCIFAGLGIIFAIFCLVVLIWKRKHREIRYSFYLMNIVIIVGCILVYISVFLFGVDNIISPILVVDRICRARLWVFSIGFALAVGGILSKLWLAHDVLSKRILMKKKKRQRMMFAIVFVIFFITVILLICWHEINPLHRVIEYIKKEATYYCDTDIWPDSPFKTEMIAVEQCKCTNEIVWYFIMVIWKALLLLISVIWAYQSRHVFLVTVNDTQRCGLCAFIIAACSLVGLIIALTTRLLPDVFFGIVGLIIIGCVTAVLIILFLHKILLVFQSTRRKLASRSATEDDDDKNCLSRCLSRVNCCSKCCRGNCPKCFRCCLLCCAPFLACLSWIFACCGSCCRNCCCGSKSQRNGTERAGEQKFIVNGVGNDKSAELARLQRELEMKNRYISNLKRTELPSVTPIWTQTTEQMTYFSDDYETDTNSSDSDKQKRDAKKRGKFKMVNKKLNFSHVQSRTDSNFKNGQRQSVVAHSKDHPREAENAEVNRLTYLLAERDAELNRLRYGSGKPNAFELQEIDESIEVDMKKGLKKDKETNVDKPGDDDYDALLKEFNVVASDAPPQRAPADQNRSSVKISHQHLDWSQVPSKLAATGAIANGGVTTPIDKDKNKESPPGIKNNRVSPSPGDSPSGDPGTLSVGSPNNNRGRRGSNVKIFSQNADYSHVKSSLSTTTANGGERRGSSVKIVSDPKDYSHVKSKLIPDSAPKAKAEGSGDTSPRDKPNSDVKILNDPKDYSHVKSSLSTTTANGGERRGSSVKIVSDPKDYSHVKSKLIPDSAPKGKTEGSGDTSPRDKPNSDVKILNDPKDYSHVKSSLSTTTANGGERRGSSVKIVSDPKDYSHVKSKLIPDSAPKAKEEGSGDTSPRDKPNSDVKILNDPKNYNHIKSTLGSTPVQAAKKNNTVKITNKPVDYSHVKSKLS